MHARRAVVLAFLVLVGCKQDDLELKPGLRPAKGVTVSYTRFGGIRCYVFVEEYPGADGKGSGNQCVSKRTLEQICELAEKCEEKPRTKPAAERTPRLR